MVEDYNPRTGVRKFVDGHSPADACGHTVRETAAVIEQVKALTTKELAAILAE